MNTLYLLSLQNDKVLDYVDNLPWFSTGDFFQRLLLLIQWETYHHRHLSDFTPAILDDLEANGLDAELHLHFDHLLNYSNGPATDINPTICDLHPNFLTTTTLPSKAISTTPHNLNKPISIHMHTLPMMTHAVTPK